MFKAFQFDFYENYLSLDFDNILGNSCICRLISFFFGYENRVTLKSILIERQKKLIYSVTHFRRRCVFLIFRSAMNFYMSDVNPISIYRAIAIFSCVGHFEKNCCPNKLWQFKELSTS